MVFYDFDRNSQEMIDNKYKSLSKVQWRKWLDISSMREYEEEAIRNAGLDSIDELYAKISSEEKNISYYIRNLHDYLTHHLSSTPLIMCHTSGTTNSKFSALKWFNMTEDSVQRFWAPGMQAIFESSGLTTQASAIIFVPSRLANDGIQKFNGKKYLSLYSSEFSQRIVLSLIKPQSYLFSEYKNSNDLDILAKILSLNNIAVISAPANTVLNWSNIEKLKNGLEKGNGTSNDSNPDENPLLKKLKNFLETKGVDFTSKYIQAELSKRFESATLIFSISSLSEKDWNSIRSFMNWKKGNEKFTNLYVASEVGPFASSITQDNYEISRSNLMYVFPLTLPYIESKQKKYLISQCKNKIGRLLITRIGLDGIYFNIDVGDVIHVVNNQPPLPLINGKILRGQFELKYPIKLNPRIKIDGKSKIFAGDYFALSQFEIHEPRNLLHCINNACKSNLDSMLLKEKDENWKLYMKENEYCKSDSMIKNAIVNCQSKKEFENAILRNRIQLDLLEDSPIDFLTEREIILANVRQGKNPKGILKKWPLYVVIDTS